MSYGSTSQIVKGPQYFPFVLVGWAVCRCALPQHHFHAIFPSYGVHPVMPIFFLLLSISDGPLRLISKGLNIVADIWQKFTKMSIVFWLLPTQVQKTTCMSSSLQHHWCLSALFWGVHPNVDDFIELLVALIKAQLILSTWPFVYRCWVEVNVCLILQLWQNASNALHIKLVPQSVVIQRAVPNSLMNSSRNFMVCFPSVLE